MIDTGMTTLDDLANLFAVYYFFYVSQVCIVLDHFCSGKRTDKVHLYYALTGKKYLRIVFAALRDGINYKVVFPICLVMQLPLKYLIKQQRKI